MGDYLGDVVELTLSADGMDDMVIGVPFDDGYTYSETVCLDLEGCYTVTVTGDDSYGASNEASFDVVSGDSVLLSVSSTSLTSAYTFGTCVVGCTDETADNYNPDADISDNSLCEPAGCTSALANNFDPNALFDDGSCVVCIDGEEVTGYDLTDLPDEIITVTINTGGPETSGSSGNGWSGEIH